MKAFVKILLWLIAGFSSIAFVIITGIYAFHILAYGWGDIKLSWIENLKILSPIIISLTVSLVAFYFLKKIGAFKD